MARQFEIWEMAPHLCGLPSRIARKRLLLVQKAFIDESGKTTPRVFVMAGFVGHAQDWARFSDAWEAACPNGFHFVEHDIGEDFDYLMTLARLLREHFPLGGIAATVYHADWAATFKGRIARRMDRPYWFMAHTIMRVAMMWQVRNEMDEPIDFIFDEQKEESDFFQSNWAANLDLAQPEIKRRFGSRPIHVPDDGLPPLQAADYLAGLIRRATDYTERGEQELARKASNLLNTVTVTGWSISREDLQRYIAEMRTHNLNTGMVFPHQMRVAAENADLLISRINAERIRTWTSSPIPLLSIEAKELKRFHLVDRCPRDDTPHLHKRSTRACLSERAAPSSDQSHSCDSEE